MLGSRGFSRLARCLVIASLLGASSASASLPAQIALAGRVVDASGQPMAEVPVLAMPGAGGGAVDVDKSGTDGGFTLHLAPGRYIVFAELLGFTDTSREITVEADAAPAELVLAVTAMRESITVEAEPGYRLSTLSSAMRTPTQI